MELLKGKSMWVIKIGGSLLGNPVLLDWLQVVAKLGDGQVVIVPGGGIFADTVRNAQKVSGMSEHCAHVLAVKSMDQYGLLLQDLVPELVTASTELELAERSWQHRGIVWLPSHMVLSDDSITQSWEVTSDSLAAWLARKLSAKHLVVVKEKKLDKTAVVDWSYIRSNQLVDDAFDSFVECCDFSTWILHSSDIVAFQSGFTELALNSVAKKIVD
jgi:aspartokinase-like uncharacterized kinase